MSICPPIPTSGPACSRAAISCSRSATPLTVPQSAVVVRDGFTAVFEVGEGGRVAMRQVKTGQRTGDRVEILSGLQERATLVERGGAFLNDGDTVRVEASGAAAPAAAASTAKSAGAAR